MKVIKNIIIWILCIYLLFYIMYLAEVCENKKEKVCEDKGMILINPHQGKSYCSFGSREGL